MRRAERIAAEREKELERADPTPGRFRTTIRPLDGFSEEFYADDDDDDDDPTAVLTERPSVRSYGRHSARARAAYPAGNSSTAVLADAHYAKALRMLSSDFDRRRNGGNALPHPVLEGEVDQDIDTGGRDGRGDGFAKAERLPGRRRIKRKAKRRKARRRKETTSADEGGDDSKKGGNGAEKGGEWEPPEDEPILDVVLDVAYQYYDDTLDWVYESLGIEMDRDDDSNNGGGGGDDDEYAATYEEDHFSWKDTRVGSQLIWIYGKATNARSRRRTPPRNEEQSDTSSSSSTEGDDGGASLSERDATAREGLFHLERAAALGHSEAQRAVANSLASGILPLSDHSLMRRVARRQHARSDVDDKNWTSTLLQSTLRVPDDFSSGGQQLSRAVVLWHLSAMDGNVESAMALGYRHLYSASAGSTRQSDLANAAVATSAGKEGGSSLSPGYHPVTGGPTKPHGTTSVSHYGVLGTCPTALAYYEAAAHGTMDELEAGPTRGKVNPPLEEHRLAEIYTHGGASVALDSHNKPDELEEALQYYRMLASRNRSPEPDLVAAFTIANFYFHGYRGVKQDLRLALKYYEICGDHNHWEGGGQAGLMHVWGIGMSPEERDLGRAYAYFARGTPGGLDGCTEQWRRRKRQNQKKDVVGEEVTVCDRHCVNGMGLLHLLGVEGLVDRNVNEARRWFEHGKDFGDPESSYNYAMLRLGWMVAELEDLPTKLPDGPTAARSDPQNRKTTRDHYGSYRSGWEARVKADVSTYSGPTSSDHNVALQELARAASKGHLQAKHKLGMLYAAGATVPKKGGQVKVIAPNCVNALRYFKAVADAGHTVSRRNRAAWKQYGAGDYESALRNYLGTAETGNEIGQVNAAFLLEQGHCLGMTTRACTDASIRLWRAAARQGNLEACLRVGDFYYYGRMKTKPIGVPKPKSEEGGGTSGETATLYDREEYLASLEAKAFYFMPGPYRWTRYILYPEELFDVTRKWLSRSVGNLQEYVRAKLSDASSSAGGEVQSDASSLEDAICNEADGTCSPEWSRYSDEVDADEEEDEHMAIAAQYYRRAAEEHKSSRANFNLGFMHEWGLGLTQDFPLAKRHYDLAGEDNSNMAAVIALWAMDLHQKAVRFGMTMKDYARNNNLIVEGIVIPPEGTGPAWIPADADVEPPPAVTLVSTKTKNAHGNVGSIDVAEVVNDMNFEKKKAQDDLVSIEVDVINDMNFIPTRTLPGHFPDRFETGDFRGLPWKENPLWTIKSTNQYAPFDSEYSAFTSSRLVSDEEKASLKLDINSVNGGRLCFNLFAEVGMPFEDFRLYRNAETLYQFTYGTTGHMYSWVDVCFDIPAGEQALEWALARPGYWDDHYKTERFHAMTSSARAEHMLKVSGDVFVDNVRFYPFVYDDFETGIFSPQTWKQNGDGAPWIISDFNAFGRYSAHVGPTVDYPSGTSNLEFIVDLGYTGALLKFWVKVKSENPNIDDRLWFLVDNRRVRPWLGDTSEYVQYGHELSGGIHRLTWSFTTSGNDPEVGAWLDNVRIYSRDGDDKLRAEYRDLGWVGRKKGLGPPGVAWE